MPKTFLSTFQSFASGILPHQVMWIMENHKMKDPEKIRILNVLENNLLHPSRSLAFPVEADRRKYSYIKNRIIEKLNSIDVDVFYQWLCDMDKSIMTDSLSQEDEKKIINLIQNTQKPGYYFLRFFELVQNYRHFLLIRVRQENYQITGSFLERFQPIYDKCRSINQTLHNATLDIVQEYRSFSAESRKWEQWLIDVFEDDSIDGLNRYFAIVRLTFLYYVYKEYDRLLALFDKLDKLFAKGEFYSPRILVNYYANRVLVHTRENDLKKAEYYGFLSIRYKTSDYLQYLNNLCAVLMRRGKNEEALALMTNSFPEFKKTLSSHNRIGFVSFYIQALIRNNKPGEAAEYARSFLENHKKDILNTRWHLFFTSYVFALLQTENYNKILSLEKKYQLLGREEAYRKKAGYIPSFIWIYQLAQYKELHITSEQLWEALYETALPYIPDKHKFRLMKEMCHELMPHHPEVFQRLFDTLFRESNYKVTPGFSV